MIPREDFAISDSDGSSYEKFERITLNDLKDDGLTLILRKPDFQRETNHWVPDQVVSLLECFVNGDLIPSVIVWKSPLHLFVIDGGHRLSVLRAWILDDYGDGPVSQAFFGNIIAKEQLKAAQRVRDQVSTKIGTWQHFQQRKSDTSLETREKRRFATAITRGIPVQWVEGDAEKAEASFFKINTKGTPLDEVEELLLSNRRKPIAIGARAIIRAGKGHKYWSKFEPIVAASIEATSRAIHQTLFSPELDSPVKTLELPLGGSTGVRAALQVLIDFILAAIRDQSGAPKNLKDQEDDVAGEGTEAVLRQTERLASRMTGNDKGSLGLHPAVYFYGPTGRHLSPMFLGLAMLISRKLINNNSAFFRKFTDVRERLENALIDHKDLVATILQRTISKKRSGKYADLIDRLVVELDEDPNLQPTEGDIVQYAEFQGKILTGQMLDGSEKFSDDTKSAVFIRAALRTAIKCPICNGYLDTAKSVSYDHIKERSKGGTGMRDNCQLTHPYCNQSVKNSTSGAAIRKNGELDAKDM